MPHLTPSTDPDKFVESVRGATRQPRVAFEEPLPDSVMAALADAVRVRPDTWLTVGGTDDRLGDLAWLDGLAHLQYLTVRLYSATTFDPIGHLSKLRTLQLDTTKSSRPNLSCLRGLPELEYLEVQGHGKDADAIGELKSLRRMLLSGCRSKSLGSLSALTRLEKVEIYYGGTRDLSGLAELPELRDLLIWQIRLLDADDLAPLGRCGNLEWLSLGGLRNVRHLRALTEAPSDSLIDLSIEQLSGLDTLADLARCRSLRFLGLNGSRPADRDLTVLADGPSLDHIGLGGFYGREEINALVARFRGKTLEYRGKYLVGKRVSRQADLAPYLPAWYARRGLGRAESF